MADGPVADPVAEAARVLSAAERAGVSLRAIGGVAIALHTTGAVPSRLRRPYGDIDLVTEPLGAAGTVSLLRELGYKPNERFNALNGATRLVLYDLEHERQLDVFVGEFRMCHAVPLGDRLELERLTVPLAELLLTKLQVVEANRKDIGDIFTLVLEHDVGHGDEETINSAYIGSLLAADWGFWRTAHGTIDAARAQLGDWSLEPRASAVIDERLQRLLENIDSAPKTLRWRARARIGERVRWYELPEEIDHPDPDRR